MRLARRVAVVSVTDAEGPGKRGVRFTIV